MMRGFSALVMSITLVAPARADEPHTGPWDLAALKKPPRVTWVDTSGPLRKLYYENEPVQGKPTRVFAYYAQPEKFTGKLPAVFRERFSGRASARPQDPLDPSSAESSARSVAGGPDAQ